MLSEEEKDKGNKDEFDDILKIYIYCNLEAI